MRTSHRRQATALLACAFVLAACGGSDPAAPHPDPDPGATSAPGDDEATAEDGDGDADQAAPDVTDDEQLQAAVTAAKADVTGTSDLDPAAIEVVAAERVTWADGSLGCPEPDQMYTMALVEGYRVVLALDDGEAHYHGALGQAPFRCEDPQPPADPGT